MTSLPEWVDTQGGPTEVGRRLGVSPATVRYWLRMNPRGFLKFAPELRSIVAPESLVSAVAEHEEELRI